MRIRMIGDVHNDIDHYQMIAGQAEHSIQVGDLGFDYSTITLDPKNHKVVAGNHDNYHSENGVFVRQTPHFLGDFGTHHGIFFVRGGFSIDHQNRIQGQTWFPDEELSYRKMMQAIEMYNDVKPDFVVTHECPEIVSTTVFGRKTYNRQPIKTSNTGKMLQAMWENHQPKIWVFGHHHENIITPMKGTTFVCLGILHRQDFEI